MCAIGDLNWMTEYTTVQMSNNALSIFWEYEAENIYNKYLETNINLYFKMKTSSLLSILLWCRIHNDIIRGELYKHNDISNLLFINVCININH